MKFRNPIRRMAVVEKRKTYIPHLLTVLLGWSLAMTMDYNSQLHEAEEKYHEVDRAFTECLRGNWKTVTPDGVEWGCMEVQKFDPRNRSKGTGR